MQTGYKVIDVMTNKPVVASKEMSLKDAARLMEKENVNSLLVVEDEKAIGIITDEDFVRKVIAPGLDPRKLKLKDIMVADIVSIGPGKDIYDALLLMREHVIRQLPVVDKGKLAGFLTAKDVLKIEPELIDIMAEQYELREEERKLKEDDGADFFKKLKIKKKK